MLVNVIVRLLWGSLSMIFGVIAVGAAFAGAAPTTVQTWLLAAILVAVWSLVPRPGG